MIINDKTIATKGYQLANHIEIDFKFDHKNKYLFNNLCQMFNRFGIDFNYNSLFKLFSKVMFYSFNTETMALDKCKTQILKTPIEDLRGIKIRSNNSYGIYIAISHSCDPNACVLNSNQIQFRAIKPIDINEKITIS
jgi:hypothetical protein